MGWLDVAIESNSDPHVLVTWVKEIRQLSGRTGAACRLRRPRARQSWAVQSALSEVIVDPLFHPAVCGVHVARTPAKRCLR